jgi:hypothetical protein
MQKEKLSLKGIKNVLTRGELKKIMAGGSGGTCNEGSPCGPGVPVVCCSFCAPYAIGSFCL